MQKNDVLVSTSKQTYGCGALKLRKGAIVKAAENPDFGTIEIYRCLSDEKSRRNSFYVNLDGLRLANSDETKMYYDGIRTLS